MSPSKTTISHVKQETKRRQDKQINYKDAIRKTGRQADRQINK